MIYAMVLKGIEMVLKEPYYVPILTMLPVILIKRGVMALKGNQEPLLLLCESRIRAKMAVLCRGMT